MADIPTLPSSQHPSRSPPRPYNIDIDIDKATTKAKPRRRSLPFVFPPLLPKNTSSTFLIPSTAEGRPVPLDGSTAAHRTTALRQLNRSQPSPRHRYTRSTEPPAVKSTTTETYSQPIVVRTYSGLPTSSPAKGPVSVSTIPPPSSPLPTHPSRDGTIVGKMRYKGNDKPRSAAGAKMPPLESFSFRSIIADIQQDVGADLDRIAEICARSRYSLSNQYEVHIAPHASGPGFVPSSSLSIPAGPTLQAISSDDEHISPIQRKRRSMGRRRSVAYGTLETIMSSSRSSDEERYKKKPAAEIVNEVRGRANDDDNSENTSEENTDVRESSEQHEQQRRQHPQVPVPIATAILDNSTRQRRSSKNIPYQIASETILVSSPAQPHTSRSHLQTRTSPEGSSIRYYIRESSTGTSQILARESVAGTTISRSEHPNESSTLSTWLPWKTVSAPRISQLTTDRLKGCSSYAEGSLRDLLGLAGPFRSADKSFMHGIV